MTSTHKTKLIMTSSILLILFIIIYYLLRINSFEVDHFNYFLKSIQFICVVDCFVITIHYKNKHLNRGYILILLALCLEFLSQLLIKQQVFDLILTIIHYILIFLGIIKIMIGKNRNLDQLQHLNHQLKDSNHELRELAYHNPITNLPNRNYLMTICKETDLMNCTGELCLFKDSIVKNHQVGILFLDIDDFKMVNDLNGH